MMSPEKCFCTAGRNTPSCNARPQGQAMQSPLQTTLHTHQIWVEVLITCVGPAHEAHVSAVFASSSPLDVSNRLSQITTWSSYIVRVHEEQAFKQIHFVLIQYCQGALEFSWKSGGFLCKQVLRNPCLSCRRFDLLCALNVSCSFFCNSCRPPDCWAVS